MRGPTSFLLVLLPSALLACCEPAPVEPARHRRVITVDSARAPEAVPLTPGRAWTGRIDFAGDARVDFRIDVPADAVRLRIDFDCDVAGLELRAARGAPTLDDLDESPYAAGGLDEPQTLVLEHLADDALAGNTWYVSLVWPYVGSPRLGNERISSADATVRATVIPARVDATLAPGVPLASQLDPADGGFRSFRIDVPEGAEALRIDLFDVTSDLNLYARRGGPILAFDDSIAFSEQAWGHETLILARDSRPPLEAGPWRIDVVDAVDPTRIEPFRIVASFDPRVPEVLLKLPAVPQPREGPLERALLAVGALATPYGLGSGTLLSPSGWILTNAHVTGEDPGVEIVVSLSLDPTLPAEEAFRARVVEFDAVRDLALVKIESGLYGQPLPQGYALPTLPVGATDSLSIGDPLWLVGYPATGGTGSRVSISATRGIVSGFERADFGVLLKTDAEITLGNSGGAALDAQGRLVGVPTSTVENGSGQIGYVHPLDAVPVEWWRRAGVERP
jgi:hypothetical protein